MRRGSRIIKKLDKRISDGKVNDYYETVFAEMVADGSLSLEMVSFDGKPWYEIDTIEDLAEAEKLLLPDTISDHQNRLPLHKPGFFNMQLSHAAASPQ